MSKPIRRPLRVSIISLVTILVAITWVAETREIIRWNGAFTLAKRTLRVNANVNALLQAGQNLAFERGRTNVLLGASGLPSAENRAFIAERRKAVDDNLERCLSDPVLRSFPAFNHIVSSYSSLKALRASVDAALDRDKAERSPTIEAQWFSSTTALINDLADFSASISLLDDRLSSSFRSISRLKILAFDLRNALGMEASRIAAASQSHDSPTSEQLDSILIVRGQGLAIWASLQREGRIANNDVADFSIDMIARDFFGGFRPIQDEALAAIKARHEGRMASVRLQHLTSASVPALDSVGNALNALTAESARITESQYAQARAALLWAIAMATVAFVCGVLAILATVFRLFAPLKELGTELQRLAKGEVSTTPLKYRHHDELEHTYRAVEVFRESLTERRKLEERLTALSISDGLTGIPNRRRFDEILEDEWKRAGRGKTQLALAVFDIDLFKKYNDRHGHLAGDECLKTVALAIAACARRPGDFVARFGGEEFTAILPGLSLDEVVTWANNTRLSILDLSIPHENSPLGVVTVSVGVVSAMPANGEYAREFFIRADEALYAAKRGGRNCVVAASITSRGAD